MKYSIYIIALLGVVLFGFTPVAMNFHRQTSPDTELYINMEFITDKGRPWAVKDTYIVVLTYCNNSKPEDTFETYYSHFPSRHDIYWFDYWYQVPCFYAPDNPDKKRFLNVCDVRVIGGRVAPQNIEAQRKIYELMDKQQRGITTVVNTKNPWL